MKGKILFLTVIGYLLTSDNSAIRIDVHQNGHEFKAYKAFGLPIVWTTKPATTSANNEKDDTEECKKT